MNWVGPGKPLPWCCQQDSSQVLQGQCNMAAPSAGPLKERSMCEYKRENPTIWHISVLPGPFCSIIPCTAVYQEPNPPQPNPPGDSKHLDWVTSKRNTWSCPQGAQFLWRGILLKYHQSPECNKVREHERMREYPADAQTPITNSES